MILPDSLKLLPLYSLALLKNSVFQTDLKIDERSYYISVYLSLPPSKILNMLYGCLYNLEDFLVHTDENESTFPPSLWLSSEKTIDKSLLIYENGHDILIRIDSNVSNISYLYDIINHVQNFRFKLIYLKICLVALK